MYLQPGLKFGGVNRTRLLAAGSFVPALSDPWVILADWNLEPPEWGKSEWLGKIRGAVVTPSNAKTTCGKGQGRMCDYAVAKQGWHHRLRLQAFTTSPGRPTARSRSSSRGPTVDGITTNSWLPAAS
eukprot:7152609-Pyramimonas_sp.AAC.1